MDKLVVATNPVTGVKYCLFYGAGRENGVLSNFARTPFVYNGMEFLTVEHFMHWRKAICFHDVDIASRILLASAPMEAKQLGRLVGGFDEKLWTATSYNIVRCGLILKFTSTQELTNLLLDCDADCFVECSPWDKIWGIGISADDKSAIYPEKWLGQNKLGRCIGEVRDILVRKKNGET